MRTSGQARSAQGLSAYQLQRASARRGPHFRAAPQHAQAAVPVPAVGVAPTHTRQGAGGYSLWRISRVRIEIARLIGTTLGPTARGTVMPASFPAMTHVMAVVVMAPFVSVASPSRTSHEPRRATAGSSHAYRPVVCVCVRERERKRESVCGAYTHICRHICGRVNERVCK